MAFLGGLFNAAKSFILPALAPLIGEGISAIKSFIGSNAGGLVDTIGKTGTGIISNIGQRGLTSITNRFGSTAGGIARSFGNELSSSVGRSLKSQACAPELAKIRELEEELDNLKRIKLGTGNN